MGKQELGTRTKSEQRAAEQGSHVYVLLATLPLHKPGNRVSRQSALAGLGLIQAESWFG